MRLPSGFEEEQKRAELPILPSGDRTLDELLGGGFRKDFVYLLYGDKKNLADILLTTIVNSYRDQDYSQKVAFVDAVNRFNPYHISKLAVSHRLSPSKVLESILISRAFTWEQFVE